MFRVCLLIELILTLSGCGVADALLLVTMIPGSAGGGGEEDYYEPIILASNENRITIKYFSAGRNAKHEQAKQVMSEHCNGAYVEISRTELGGYDTVEAECT